MHRRPPQTRLIAAFLSLTPINKKTFPPHRHLLSNLDLLMMLPSDTCRHSDVRDFDGMQCCLECGETEFATNSLLSENPSLFQEHTYEALECLRMGDVIRLITIIPGDFADPVSCTLESISLEAANYDAISYAWATESGDDSRSQTIYIDGKTLSVTKNCEAALRRLRHKIEHTKLWVDAICIHQGNLQERNHQVGLMNRIYSNAARVHICVEDPGRAYSHCVSWLENHSSRDISWPLGTAAKSQLEALFACRYFSRVWVIQEVALAKNLTLHVNRGHVELTSRCLLRLKDICTTSGVKLPGVLGVIGTQNYTVFDILRVSMDASCSDPRDHIYGVHSLLQSSFRSMVPVDYSKSVNDVLIDVVKACIEHVQSLQILLFASLPHQYDDLTIAASFTAESLYRYISSDRVGEWEVEWNIKDQCWRPHQMFLGQAIPSTLEVRNAQNTPCSLQSSTLPLPRQQILPRLQVLAHLLVTRHFCLAEDFNQLKVVALDLGGNPEDLRYDAKSALATFESIDHSLFTGHGVDGGIRLTDAGIIYTRFPTHSSDRVAWIQGVGSAVVLRAVSPRCYRVVGVCVWYFMVVPLMGHKFKFPETTWEAQAIEVF